MYIGSLREISDPFINAFMNEQYSYMIKSLREESCLHEEEQIVTSNPEKTQGKLKKFVEWIKTNALHKPRAWLAKILTRLNQFASKIVYLEEIKPFERSLWSKIKTIIAAAIVWVTNKLENFIRPDKIGKRKNENLRSTDFKELESRVNDGRRYIKDFGPTDSEKRNYIIHKHQIKSWDDMNERNRLLDLEAKREGRALRLGKSLYNIYDVG